MSQRSLSQSNVKYSMYSSQSDRIKQRIMKSKSFNSLKSYYNSAVATISSAPQLNGKHANITKRNLWSQITNSMSFTKKNDDSKVVDILLVNGNDAIEYSKHIAEYLLQVGNIKLHSKSIENSSFIEDFLNSEYMDQVTLFVISPDFLEFVETQPKMHTISKRLSASKTFAVLCGLKLTDLTDYHRTRLIHFDHWFCFVVNEHDQHNINNVCKQICQILFDSNHCAAGTTNLKCNTISRLTLRRFRDKCLPRFKLSTKKIDEENRKIFILLKQPLQHKQKLRIILDFSPDHGLTDVKEAQVTIENVFTAKLVVAEKYVRPSMTFTVNVYIDGVNSEFLGSRSVSCVPLFKAWLPHTAPKTSLLKEQLSSAITSENATEVDTRISQTLSTLLANEEYTLLHNGILKAAIEHNKEYPTLLHFSAKYGLKKMANTLLQCPDALIAARLSNNKGLNASQLAFQSNFGDIGRNIERFIASNSSPNFTMYRLLNNDNLNNYQEIGKNVDSSLGSDCCASAMDSIRSAIEFDYDVPKVLRDLLQKIKLNDHSSSTKSCADYVNYQVDN